MDVLLKRVRKTTTTGLAEIPNETIIMFVETQTVLKCMYTTTNRNNDNGYRFTLDMSSAASGVYIIKVGTLGSTASKSERIIVK